MGAGCPRRPLSSVALVLEGGELPTSADEQMSSEQFSDEGSSSSVGLRVKDTAVREDFFFLACMKLE